MKSIPRFFGLAVVALLICATARSEELDWKQKTVELTANARQEKAEAVFAFKNNGPKRVTIHSATPSCDCTKAELEKKVFEPGESGELKVVYKIEGRVGRQEKTIAVTTADEPQSPTVLTLRVNIPELVEIKPRLVLWQVAEQPTEKAVDVYLVTNFPLGIMEVMPDDPAIEARVETITPNRQYRVWVKPSSTARPVRAVVQVKTKEVGTERISAFNIHAQIR